MKVLFDISILGFGYVHLHARTGIYRVVKNLAENLILHPECELLFTATAGMEVYTYGYLKTNQQLANVPFSFSPHFDKNIVATSKKRYSLMNKVMIGESNSKMETVADKLKIKSLLVKEKIYNLANIKSSNFQKYLAEANVYHSTYFPIPPQVRKANKKSVFITSYDLIPIYGKQFVSQSHTEEFKQILDSITPDTWVLCISNHCREELLHYKGNTIDPARVMVTQLAAGDSFYKFKDEQTSNAVRRKYNIPEGPYVLSVCSIDPRKNISSVLKAFAQLIDQQKMNDLNLVLAGGKGMLFDKLLAEIKSSSNLKNRVIITGYVDDEDLAPLYSEAMMFVYPTFYEGFGLPPLEAMKCGTPVITSNTSSLPEVVGDAGIMVEPTDVDAMAQAMLNLYKDESLRAVLSEKAIQRASLFSWERCATETVEAYKKSLS